MVEREAIDVGDDGADLRRCAALALRAEPGDDEGALLVLPQHVGHELEHPPLEDQRLRQGHRERLDTCAQAFLRGLAAYLHTENRPTSCVEKSLLRDRQSPAPM